jgi:multicomponent Na+:H+ antiporter subunit E
MNFALMVLGFAVGWAAITGGFTLPNLVLGGVLGGVAVYLFAGPRTRPAGGRRLRRVWRLTLLFIYELVLSAVRVGVLVVRPDMMRRIAPAVVAFPLRARKDAEITLLANLITLTPGTLSVEVSNDRALLYVHALECRDRGALVRQIAEGFERQVIEVFEP